MSGIILIAIGLISWLEVASLDTGTMRYFGPGMLPRALSIVLFAAGGVVLAVGILQQGMAVEYFRASLRGPVVIATALVVFAATIRGVDVGGSGIPQLGLLVAGPLAVIIAGYASQEANLRDLSALGLGLTAACAALFDDVLGMTIPVLPKALESAASDWIGGTMAARAAYAGYAVLAVLIVVFVPRAHASPGHEGQEGG